MTAKKVVVSAALRTTVALFGSVMFWCWGTFDDSYFNLLEWDFWCGAKDINAHEVTGVDQHLFLPSAVCHFTDGSSKQLVPWFIVPSMFLCLAVAVFIVVHAIHTLNKYELWV
ncbi:hypothetical protein HH310_05025 [Actinoplanes sp. TBRC 11911]|uniref:hypothetical protein n=1 Tax=Actinoplanes sp. TBRC 11911 TaxID=2729386 RepID=UPI00145D7E36|nr:hypothetical protein [Actinoplanes sp. TBRC 11911]NMO50556.1 hypothetical protein [Actinoplanes sp. TBRC 11911]